MEVYQSYQSYYCTKPPEKINPQTEEGILNYWQSKWKITVSLPLFLKKDFLPKKASDVMSAFLCMTSYYGFLDKRLLKWFK